MLYEKCKEKLTEKSISMGVTELDIIRKALALIDEDCLQLSLLDIEGLWGQFTNYQCKSFVPIDKPRIKNFLSWMSHEFLDDNEMLEIYEQVNKLKYS